VKTPMTISQAFHSPAELAVACQQWIALGSCSDAAFYAVLAYRMARKQHPSTFPRPDDEYAHRMDPHFAGLFRSLGWMR